MHLILVVLHNATTTMSTQSRLIADRTDERHADAYFIFYISMLFYLNGLVGTVLFPSVKTCSAVTVVYGDASFPGRTYKRD